MQVKGAIFADGGEQWMMTFTKGFLVFIILDWIIAPRQAGKSCSCSQWQEEAVRF